MPKLKIDQNIPNSGFYLFGGLNDHSCATNDLWILRLTGDSVSWYKPDTLGTQPQPRCDHSAVFANTCLVVYGGKGVLETAPPEMGLLRIETMTWERVSLTGTLPPPRWSHCATFLGSKVLVLGGIYYQTFQPADLYVLETDSPYAVELAKQYHQRLTLRAKLRH